MTRPAGAPPRRGAQDRRPVDRTPPDYRDCTAVVIAGRLSPAEQRQHRQDAPVQVR
jgi:hypothetical protein